MVIALDSNFNTVEYLKKTIVLLWERKYYECGKFTLTMPLADYQTSFKYIYFQDHLEAGVIQSTTVQDDLIQLGGFFIEKLLDDKIIYPTFNFNGNIEMCARQMITQFKEDIPRLELGAVAGLGTTIRMQETGEELGKRIYALYQSQQMSYRLRYDYIENKIFFETYKGKDLRQEQSTNPWVTFNKNRGNVLKSDILVDSSNHKNYFIVAGGGEGAARKFIALDKSAGGYKQKMYIDARDLQQEEKTVAEYEQDLKQRGEEKATEFAKIEKYEFDLTDSESARYGVDFDLGDLVDVVVADLTYEFSARITEITETIKEGHRTIHLTVGEQVPTIYKKIRMEARI